jgi:hypothetical protein
MSRWTAEEIFEAYVGTLADGVNIIHWQTGVPFVGQFGHHYFLRHRHRALRSIELAKISAHSGNAEAALCRVNNTYIVTIGAHREAVATMQIPSRQEGIEEFEWIAHTHPLEQENREIRVPRGSSRQDYDALGRAFHLWGQSESVVIVCRGGRVVEEVLFRFVPEVDTRPGHLWTPDSH